MFPTEPAAVNNGFGALLKNRGFMLLWIGQLISQLADKVFFVLMIALLKALPTHQLRLADNCDASICIWHLPSQQFCLVLPVV